MISCKECLNGFENENVLSDVIVFGTGKIGKIITFILEIEKISIVGCFDNDLSKANIKLWGKIPCTVPCMIESTIPVIISVEDLKMKEAIRKQCKMLGYKKIYDINILKLYQYVDELPDKEFLKLQYHLRTNGKILNLEHPKLFNEKIQWLKLYDRNPEYHNLVDKYEVKKIIAQKIGKEHIIETIGIWNTFDEIDFEKLPNQFVLKCTHDSGSAVICKDKIRFDIKSAGTKLEFCRKRNYYCLSREWVYKDLRPRIIAEVYMKDAVEPDLKDYKIFCFNGIPRLIQVDGDRFSGHYRNLYTTTWKYIDGYIEYPTNSNKISDVPKQLNEMLRLAKILSEGILFVRVDFYIINEKIYFGELTFSHGAGYEDIFPESLEMEMGNWINLDLQDEK